MNPKTYRLILTFIVAAILATLALQLHWNMKNYHESRRQLSSEIQLAFDNSVETYYAHEVRHKFFHDIPQLKRFLADRRPSTLRVQKFTKFLHRTNTSSDSAGDQHETLIIRRNGDLKFAGAIPDLKEFADKIFISMATDTLNLKKLDSVFKRELSRKNMSLNYNIDNNLPKASPTGEPRIQATSRSIYLPPESNLTLLYDEPTLLILKRNIVEITLSFIFSLMLIACLLYLLAIINKQKKIDEIKNDLISNITHEFKTPITTISSALEGMLSFDVLNDRKKTKRYLEISTEQLEKLGLMVEKLLETATLDTNALKLNKQPEDIATIAANVVEKQKLMAGEKRITLDAGTDIIAQVDTLHFENALANLIDNAVKYGGKNIEVHLARASQGLTITVSDDGPGIEKLHRDKIFENFFRVPKGNVHDVKGFGIGLYYSKKIIEKHGGSLELANLEKTTFVMSLPYA
ncbi:MAG TPA: HAMP domain-containing sensor histidine kinase [Flavobacterium sp.]|jgi:two-component system phosphate regulon sensor histidine kinase PhoR